MENKLENLKERIRKAEIGTILTELIIDNQKMNMSPRISNAKTLSELINEYEDKILELWNQKNF